jgi:hypothetical protein
MLAGAARGGSFTVQKPLSLAAATHPGAPRTGGHCCKKRVSWDLKRLRFVDREIAVKCKTVERLSG